MTDVIVRGRALRWVSDDFPGWIEVGVRDVHGEEHSIVDKVPVLTKSPVTAATGLPSELWLAAEIAGVDGEHVAITFASGVETVEGLSGLTVSAADVVWLLRLRPNEPICGRSGRPASPSRWP